MCSTPNLTRGVKGAPDLLLFPFVKTISRVFSYKAALLRCGGLQEKRKLKKKEQERKKERSRKRIKQRNHNYGIKEHDIS